MNKTDFNNIINRCKTGSIKWDFMQRNVQHNETDLLPLWISDYDFACPPEVLLALHHRVDHGIFGYSERDEQYYQAVIDWFSRRHCLNIPREWITSIEGVVPGLALLLQMLSKPGDAIVVQGPYCTAYDSIITLNGRTKIDNPLIASPRGYKFDFDHLQRCFEQRKPALLLLCNPHNPTGRCWTRSELTLLMALCRRYKVTVVADEIWADILLPGESFTSVLHLEESWHDQLIVATSASKTFGLTSLRISNFLIPNSDIRDAFLTRLTAHGLDVFNALSMTAATAAYQWGDPWLDEVLHYLAENRRWFEQALAYGAPWCKMTRAESTSLAWLDCRALGLDDDALQHALIQQSKIVVSMGNRFGEQGKGFIRINLGCPRQHLEKAIAGLEK